MNSIVINKLGRRKVMETSHKVYQVTAECEIHNTSWHWYWPFEKNVKVTYEWLLLGEEGKPICGYRAYDVKIHSVKFNSVENAIKWSDELDVVYPKEIIEVTSVTIRPPEPPAERTF